VSSASIRQGAVIVLLLLSPLLGACRSSSTNVTGPSSSKCAITLSGSTQINVAGGASTIAISTNRECTWTATSQAGWIAISPGSGQGPATLGVTAQANPDVTVRRGAIVVNEARIELEQPAAACRYTLTPASAEVGADGGSLTFTVAAAATCAWTASASVPWITPQGDPRGTGSGTFSVQVTANGGAARSATVSVGDSSATVSQASGASACLYSVTSSATAFGQSGGSGTLTITTSAPSCSWTASPNVPWIIVGTSSGVGSSTVPFTVQANSGGARAGGITVASSSVTFTQTGTSACAYVVTPTSRTVAATGGSDEFVVQADAGCAWTGVSNAPWLSISSGASGSGNGRVAFTAAPNQGAARSGTLAIAGSLVTVSQPATTCTFAVVPGSASFAQSGGTASFNVTTASGCTWTATSPDAWVTITGGATGTGSAVVSIAVAANGGTARTSVLTIAGQPVTVSQTGTSCSYALQPTGLSATATGGANSVAVTAPAGCSWTASSNDAWLSISSGSSGSGNGTVNYSVGANTGAARIGTLTIANQTFTVTQAAPTPTCTYTIQPTSSSIGATASSIPVTLTTQAGCAWTVASNASWLTVSGTAAGNGSATVTINAEANTSTSPRTGTVTIGGQTLTVTQAGAACGYTVAPLTLSPTSAGGSSTITITTTAGCLWTAASNAPWITISGSASGSGSGSVSIGIAANTDTQARTGTVTVAGQTVTVTQAAAACTYSVSPSLVPAPATQSTASVTVTTGSGCTWAASTNDAWITIAPPSSGTGNGSVSFTIGTNTTGQPRTGQLIVAGQTVVVSQQ